MARPKSICTIAGCGKNHRAHGYCNGHLHRWQKYGDPLAGRASKGAILPWVHAHVGHQGDDCLTWPFSLDDNGRGAVTVNGKQMFAHRYMCQLVNGPPPEGHETAHNCGKGHLGCVNPKHLRWATHGDNLRDMIGHGTSMRGTRSPACKLTEEQVHEIRSLWPGLSQRAIGERYGVTQQTVNDILTRRNWGWLT